MPEIEILSPEVIDQIAAGEVVERPAHMVKELVENSLDAGATEVEIEMAQGGRYLKIVDNGQGIKKEQLPLALARHATSKIRLSSDIWGLTTYGFRGEALASLSAVSCLQMTSKPKGQTQAYMIRSEFGQVSSVEPSGGGEGTQVVVESLFANVPARLKFLKSDSAEVSQIKNVLKAMAMAYPQTTFKIKQDSKIVFLWPAKSNRLERAKQVLDLNDLYPAEFSFEGFKLEAALSAPNETTGTSRQIWLFAQNRWVQDRSMQAAVMDAYRSLLMHGEYPYVALWLSCDPEDIDVNIHPTKSQVKFREPSKAFRAVLHGVRSTLEKAPWLGSLLTSQHSKPREEALNISTEPLSSSYQVQGFSGEDFQRVQFAQKHFPAPEFEKGLSPVLSVRDQLQTYGLGTNNFKENKAEQDEDLYKWSQLQVLGQADQTYIVAQSAKALIFIDQHAAHERVAYERLMSAWQGGKIEVQSYLLPLVVNLDESGVEALKDNLTDLNKLGLDLDQVGPSAVAVRAAPALLKEVAIQRSIEMVAKEMLDKGGSFAFEKCISELCATLACHSVVRAGQALSMEQMWSLLKQMDEFPLSSFCPHGRPVFVEYRFSDLERDFGRV